MSTIIEKIKNIHIFKRIFNDTCRDSKADFIEDYHNKYRDNCNGILQCRGKLGSTPNIA